MLLLLLFLFANPEYSKILVSGVTNISTFFTIVYVGKVLEKFILVVVQF